MRILLVKLLLPATTVAILYEPFIGVLFFILIAFVRPEVLTWNMVDARFALITSVLTLVSWLFHIRDPKQHADRIPVQFWWMLLFVAGVTASTFGAEASFDAAWTANFKFIKYVLFLFLMIQMINTEKRLRMVQEVMFWGVSFLVVWGFDQHFRGNERLEQVGGGDFADSSGLAALFNLMFPMVVYRMYHPNRWVRLTAYAFAPLYLVVLTFTQSRSGFLGLAAALLIIFLRTKHRAKMVLAAVPAAFIVGSLMPQTFWDRISTIGQPEDVSQGQSLTKKQQSDVESSKSRLIVWKVGWAVFEDHPLLGVGRANFGRIHHEYAYPIWYGKISETMYADLFLRYRVCHNIFLDLLVSNGLMTFIPWCLLIISVPYSLSRMRRRLGEQPMATYWRYQSYGMEAGIVAYLITGIFQDLAEVEAFYWVLMLGGITRVVVERTMLESHQESWDDAPQTPFAPAEPRATVPGVVTPGGPGAPLNPWHV